MPKNPRGLVHGKSGDDVMQVYGHALLGETNGPVTLVDFDGSETDKRTQVAKFFLDLGRVG